MYLAYFDETGDDGYPARSTDLFVLTTGYIEESLWKDNYSKIEDFRRRIKLDFGVPIKYEWHTKPLLLDKNPYRDLRLTTTQRLELCKQYAKVVALLDIEFINVCINKLMVDTKVISGYQVLDKALTYSVQRIQNTLKRSDPGLRFLVITDDGRVPSMRRTTRKIQRVNFVPDKFGAGAYRDEITMLIEDPLPKPSKESHFIQICDFVSFFSYLKLIDMLNAGSWHNRLSWMSIDDVNEILEILKPVLNLKANSGVNEYGFVIYPK